jgi:hypothetical protein
LRGFQENVGDVLEYLVPLPLLARLAAAAGLEPLVSANFHEFSEQRTQRRAGTTDTDDNLALLRRMRVLDRRGTISAEEWEAAGLYRVFAFRKPLVAAPPRAELQLPGMAAVMAAAAAAPGSSGDPSGLPARGAGAACSNAGGLLHGGPVSATYRSVISEADIPLL